MSLKLSTQLLHARTPARVPALHRVAAARLPGLMPTPVRHPVAAATHLPAPAQMLARHRVAATRLPLRRLTHWLGHSLERVRLLSGHF